MGLLLLMGGSDYNVRSELFGAGEVGAWYDPSDFSTMWQDAAGNTPVTASGDPVGLILDKSRSGPSMGSNQITNGGFATDTDWTKGTGWSIGSGVATKSAGSAAVLSQAQTMTAGRYYIVTYTITRSAGSLQMQFTGGSTVSGAMRNASGTYTDIVTAASGNNSIQFSADSSFAGTVDAVSVKVLSAGNHAYQVTSGARPTLNVSSGLSALSFDGSDDFLQTNAIDFTATDEMTVIAAVRKLSDAADAMIAELTAGSTNQAWGLNGPGSSTVARFQYYSRGTASAIPFTASTAFNAPVTGVITAASKISTDSAVLRVNGTQVATSASDQGTGNYANAIMYLGRRGGLSQPFNGLMYQFIARGMTTAAAKLTAAERYSGIKSGVTI